MNAQPQTQTVWAVPPHKKPKPRGVDSVDPSQLVICDDKPTIARSAVKSKYDKIFQAIKPGNAIRCQPGETSSIANGLRKWLGQRDLLKNRRIQTIKDYGDGMGRVWLLEDDK